MLNYFLLGIFSALALYHFFVFSGRQKDYSNLSFALCCMGLCLFCIERILKPIFTGGKNDYIYELLKVTTYIVASTNLNIFPHTVYILKIFQ